MSENISLEEIKKIWPSSAPDMGNIDKYVEKYILRMFSFKIDKKVVKNC